MDQPDRIHLRDLVCEAEIGAFAEERGRAQRLRFAVTADLAVPVQDAGDDVDRILSYDVLVAAVEGALAARRHDLVETLAEDIAARVLAHPAAARVEVTVEKLDRGPFTLGVTLARRRRAAAAARPVPAGLSIAVEGQGDGSSGGGPGDGASGGAAITVPATPGLPLPEGGDRLRMAWLALDQQALALGARLGLPVADSRTEIEALAASGQRLVWAPARMARAAIGLDSAEPEALARWLAEELARVG